MPYFLPSSALLLLFAAPAASQDGVPPTSVRTDAVRETMLQERRLVHGDVLAARRSRVASEEAGRVLETGVLEGDRVEAGDMLVRLDATRLQLARDILAGQAAAAVALVTERERRLDLERRDLVAVRMLAERKAANDKEVADVETAVAEATARLEQAKSQGRVLTARISLLEKRIADTVVRAPFAGTVAAVHAEIGEWMETGTSVAVIVSEELEAWLDVPQRHLGALRKHHLPFSIRIGASEEEIEAETWRLVPIVDPAARMLTIIAVLPAHASAAPGVSVSARIPIAREARRATVALDALLRNELGPFIYVAQPGAAEQPWVARPVQVDVLWRLGTRAVVAGALKEGDAAIVEGQQRLYPMAPVVPIGAGTR